MLNKVLLSFLVVLIIITVSTFFITDYFKKSTSNLVYTLSKLENDLLSKTEKKNNFDLSDFKSQWNNSKNTWAILIDHIEIDNIEESLSRLESLINIGETSQALPELAVLKGQISHIYEKERFQLKNIL